MERIQIGGKTLEGIKVWKNDGLHDVIGRVMTPNGLKDFYRPIIFQTNFGTSSGMSLQSAKTLLKSPVSVGATTMPVQNATGFFVGQEITVDDGANREELKIVGTNLIKNSNFMVEATNSEFAPTNISVRLVDGLDMNEVFLNKTVTFSYYVNCSGERENADRSFGERFGMHGSVRWKDSTGEREPLTRYPFAGGLTGTYDDRRISQTYTFDPPSGYDTIESIGFSFQPYAKPANENNEVWKLGEPKLEMGEVATPYSIAPEDTYESVDNVLSVTKLLNSYKTNSMVALSTVEIRENKMTFSTPVRYCIWGKTLHFDGLDDYVSIESFSTPDYGQITFEAWIYQEQDYKYQRIIYNGNSANAHGFSPANNTQFRFAVNIDGSYQTISTTSTLNEWVHYAGTFDGETIKLYRNGVLVDSKVFPGNLSIYTGLTFGANNNGGDYFKGKIREVRVWNVARTQEQIVGNMYSHLTNYEEGLKGYWKLDESIDNIVLDDSVNFNHGIVNGARWR